MHTSRRPAPAGTCALKNLGILNPFVYQESAGSANSRKQRLEPHAGVWSCLSPLNRRYGKYWCDEEAQLGFQLRRLRLGMQRLRLAARDEWQANLDSQAALRPIVRRNPSTVETDRPLGDGQT